MDANDFKAKLVEEISNCDEILAGKHLEKEGNFYPIGRLASIETMNVLWEKNHAWTNIVNKVRTYPQDLFDQWYASEACRMIDEEDLGSDEKTIDDSIEELRKLCKELKEL